MVLILVLLILAGCAAKAVRDGGQEPPAPVKKTGSLFGSGPSDRELFDEAVVFLSGSGREPDYKEAKIRLGILMEQFPESKWADGARALSSALDRISALQAELNQQKTEAHQEQAKLKKEIEGLKNSVRQAEEKNSAEMTRLQQENEQLKNDIRQLKNLEIRLEKREKQLR
jgi:hypothetical protein